MEETNVTINGTPFLNQLWAQQVEHTTINGRFRIVFEKAPSANRIDGFKVEVNGDDLDEVKCHADELYIWSLNKVEMNKPVQPAGK